MKSPDDTWSRAHDLALIFIALAYGTDKELSDDELATITDELQRWRDDFPIDEVQEVVLEVMGMYVDDETQEEVEISMRRLKDVLSLKDRRRALEGIFRIAEADGILLNAEKFLISVIAEAWDIKSTGERLIDQASVPLEDEVSWSLLHDIGMMYIVLAHSTDGKLSEGEIGAMVKHLNDWQPDLSEEEIRNVLRRTLSFYSQGPDQEALQSSVSNIRKMLSRVHRLVLLDDLNHIAQVDSALDAYQETMLTDLARTWGVDIRVNGEPSP